MIPNTAQGTATQVEPSQIQTRDELKAEVAQGDKNSITPRTTSQRQASRSFKFQSDQSESGAANNGVGLEDSQFSIDDLQSSQQKYQNASNTFAAANPGKLDSAVNHKDDSSL